MSASDCPFSIVRPEVGDDDKKADQFIKFEIPIDPNEPEGLKTIIQFRKLESDEPEDVLVHLRNFNKLVDDLETDEGEAHFRLFQLTLGPDAQSDWATVLEEIGDDRGQNEFFRALDTFLLSKVDRDCAINTKEWLNQVRKPRNMTVKKFMQRVKQINNLFAVMPLPEEDADEEERIDSFSEAELRNILKKASPRAWRDTQEKSNIRFDSVAAQVQYYEKLRNIDERNSNRSENKKPNNGKSNGKSKNKKTSPGNHNDSNAPCPIHGNSHTIGECKLIQTERNKYKNKKNDNGNNRGSARGSDNRNNRYSSRNHQRPAENNNIENKSRDSDSDDNYAIEEEIYVLTEDQVKQSIKETEVAIKKFDVPDNVQDKPSDRPKGSDVRVLIESRSSFGIKKKSTVLGLLDTGASNNFISKETLKYVDHTTTPANSHVNGRYGKTNIREKATFLIRLPDFASSKTIEVTALVEDNTTGRHNIVFGTPFLLDLGFNFDYQRGIITWDDVSTSMKTIQRNENYFLDDNDIQDEHLPEFMKTATKKQNAPFRANVYGKYNYRDMILRCTHLTTEQRDSLTKLFSKYEELFSGKLGCMPGPPVKLELKQEAKPFATRPYSVPKSIEHIAKKEIAELVRIGVLEKNVKTEWASPSFFRPKKDGGVRFVTDLRRLNANLKRHPYPLPVIEDVIWRISGFTFATCLDLNRGYYHFVLDEKSKKLCGIILPWGRYAYRCMPQGLMPASDIFQSKMVEIFGVFDDIITYIDNIILFTKGTFQHHLHRLNAVLEVLRTNNLHIHVEGTSLASPRVDYLGYTLTTKGIQPQIKKIIPILRFSKPTTVKQLRGFLGLINYYKKIVHRRSHILEPLTRISSSKNKFLKGWSVDQDQAFRKIKSLMARQVLLHYPDFSKPFDVYTDASQYQLGGVIAQNNFPIAFYSRKLNAAQRNYTTMEKELLSIIETATHHRGILIGFQIRFHSDHKNLSFERFQSERVLRWRLLLEEFNYEFKYTPGKDNVVADMLSRYPVINLNEKSFEELTNVDEQHAFPLDFMNISTHQTKDELLQNKVQQNSSLFKIKYINDNQLVFQKNKIYIPSSLLSHIVTWYHDNLNHPGAVHTFNTISMHFTHPRLKKFVTEHISSCIICQQQKHSIKKYGLLPPTQAIYKPWECVHIDLFGPWTFVCKAGQSHQIRAVSIIDNGLRWIELHEYHSKSSEEISLIFDREWLCRYPRPRIVVFDNGSEFSGEFFELLHSYGIQPKSTTIKNPQSNAIVERVHLTISTSLRAMDLSNRPFDDTTVHGILQSIAWALRTTFHTSLRSSPGQLAFGRDMVIPATYLANWHHITNRRHNNILYNNARENKSRIDYDYKVGDFVFILTKDIQRKLADVKKGPFRIVIVHTNATVTIQRSRHVVERVNIRRLFPAHVKKLKS